MRNNIIKPSRDGFVDNISNLEAKFTNSSISLQEALYILKDIHETVNYIYGLYEKYYIKYGLLTALILISCLVFNEIGKLLIALCLCISREYDVCVEFVRYRTQSRSRRRGREDLQETSEENVPAIGLATYRYSRGIEQ